MTSESGKTRRRYGAQFKAMVLAQCAEPGKSVAQVAMSHGINDNVVHRWRQLARGEGVQQRRTAPDAHTSAGPTAAFVPLVVPVPALPEVKTEVHLAIKRGAVAVEVTWPQQALSELAGFVRECLK